MKTKVRRLLACVVTLALLVTCTITGWVLPIAAEGANNLFSNGDFENGVPGWGWADGTTALVADGVGYNGSKGLQLNAKEDGGTVSSLVKLSLEAGKTYLLHYMVRGGISRVDYSGGQGGLDAFALKNPASNDWIQETVLLKPTESFDASLNFALYYNTTEPVYYDNFELYEYTVGMNLMPGSDGSALAGAGAFHLGSSSAITVVDPCDWLTFGEHVAANRTIAVADDPDDSTNKVWEVPADTAERYISIDYRGYTRTQYDILKVSFRFKGKDGEVPNSYITNGYNSVKTFSALVQSFVTGPDENGWRTAVAWLNLVNVNANYAIKVKFGSTKGMYVDDFSVVQTRQTATGEDNASIPGVSAMQFAESPVLLALNQTVLLHPQGKIGDVWDDNAYCGTLTWESSDTTVATVESATGLVKMVSGNNGDTATITATSSIAGVAPAACTVKVTIIEPTEIALNASRVILSGKGDTSTLSVVGIAPENSTVNLEKVTWESSDTAVATVDQNGVVTAVYSGNEEKTATITAAYEGITTPVTATVTVDNNMLPSDIFASVTENTDTMTKHESGGYHNKPYISLSVPATAEDGQTTAYTLTLNLRRPIENGKRYVLTGVLKGSLCGIMTSIPGANTFRLAWNDSAATAGDSWVELRNAEGSFVATGDATSVTLRFINAPYGYSSWGSGSGQDGAYNGHKAIEACFSDLKLFEVTEETNLLSGAAGDLVGDTQKDFSTVTQSTGDEEWYYIPKISSKTTNKLFQTADPSLVYQYSLKYKPADDQNGKFYANLNDHLKFGQTIASKVSGPDSNGWYSYTAWIKLNPGFENSTWMVYFATTAPVFAKDWACYLVPQAGEPLYGADKLLTVGTQVTLSRLVWLNNTVTPGNGIPDSDLQWTIADENVLGFASGTGSVNGAAVAVSAKAVGTTTVTITPVGDSAGKADAVTIFVKVLPNDLQDGKYRVNIHTPDASVALRDTSGNYVNNLIIGSTITVQVTPKDGFLPVPGSLRYVTADGTEYPLLNRDKANDTGYGFIMRVPEGNFTVKADVVSTEQNGYTAGTIGTGYRQLSSEQGDKVDGIRFLTRVYIDGLDLSGNTIKIKYNGEEHVVESMGTLIKRTANETPLTLENVGGSGATTVWKSECYTNTSNVLRVYGYTHNCLDFTAVMTTRNPSTNFKDRKYTSRGYIKLVGIDEPIYTTPRTDSATEAQKRATGQTVPTGPKYGVKWSVTDTDDLGSRCFDAEGLTASIGVGATAGSSDFDTIYPWSEMVRCNIKQNSSGEDTVILEGEPGFALDGSNGNVFVRVPKFYIQKYTQDGYEYRVVSEKGTQPHPAFIEDGKVLDAIYVGAFEGYIEEDKLSSVGGVIPTSNITPDEFLTAAKENGVRYTLYDNRTMDALWTLVAVEYGCRNTNRIFGYGAADYMQPDNLDHLKVRKDATASNVVSVTKKADYVTKNFMPVGSNITICRSEQANIIAQRKILSVADVGDYTEFTFDGEPIDLSSETDFIGSAALNTNYTEDCPSGAMTTWHTGRADWISGSNTRNPVRYRWIENLVGNLWHFFPDVTFKNLQMYTCSNMRNYEFFSTTGSYLPVGDLLPANSSNGHKDDVTGYNYWITSLVDNPGISFGNAYDLSLTSDKAFGAYYYLYSGTHCILNGGGFDHLWRCNMLTNRAWASDFTKWYLYGSRLQYKQIQK